MHLAVQVRAPEADDAVVVAVDRGLGTGRDWHRPILAPKRPRNADAWTTIRRIGLIGPIGPNGYRGAMSDTSSATSDGISASEFTASSDIREAFPVLGDGATAFFPTESLAASARFVHAISEIEGIEDHRPDLDVRSDGVTVRLISREPEWWGMTHRDLELARRILEVARAIGLHAESSGVQCVDPIVIGGTDIARIRPFWAALLGYEPRPDSPEEDLVDPRRRSPGVWFETMDERPEGRNRMHVAVWVPADQAEARVAAAVAAGGVVIYAERAPSWWTLADPEGNEADVSTIGNRD